MEKKWNVPLEFEGVIFILGGVCEKPSYVHQACSWKLIYLGGGPLPVTVANEGL